MNIQTANDLAKYIASLLKVNNQEANLVFVEMRSRGFNFKYCTEEKFMRESKIALKVVRLPS
jgi:hypothetical protein